MSASIEDTASVVARLESCPVQLAKLTEGLGRDRLQSPTAAEPWSANDMLAHLRANADVWGKTIARMVREDHPTIRYVSPRGFIRKSGYLDLDFHASLAAFAVQRQALVAQLRGLPADSWSRGATFTATTRGKEDTVLGYAQRIALHESAHLPQFEALLQQL